jgi:DHA3 family macrolide efflux protein-like MFS transporter
MVYLGYYHCMNPGTPWKKIHAIIIARALSMLGSELTVFTLVLKEKDRGPWMIAALLIAGALPLILFAPWAGLLADRFSTKLVVPASTIAQAVLVLSFTKQNNISLILITLFLSNTFGAVAGPAFSALLRQLTARNDMARVMGSAQSWFAFATMFAPALGGLLVGSTGYVWPFLIDASTFLLIATVPLLLHVNREGVCAQGPTNSQAMAGFRYIFSDKLMRALIVLLSVLIFAVGFINVGEVFLITNILHAGVFAYGLVGAGFAIGVILGGVCVSVFKVPETQHPAIIILALGFMSATIFGVSIARNWETVLVLLFFIGIAYSFLQAFITSLFMNAAPSEIQGRIAAGINGVVSTGSILSFAIAGTAFRIFGIRHVLAAGATLSLTTVIVFGPAVIQQGKKVFNK